MSTNGDAASAFSHPSWWDEEVQSQDIHHSTEDLYAAAQSQEETMTLLDPGGGDKLTRDPEENEQEGEDKMTW